MKLKYNEVEKLELFKLILFGYIGTGIPIGLIFGFLTLFEIIPINFNGLEMYGVSGFIFHLFTIPIFSFLLAVPTWITLFLGLKIFIFLGNLLKKS